MAEGTETSAQRSIIFTDLDGTLIDFNSYSSETTAPLARSLVAQGQALVFCSSKTLDEQRALMKSMRLSLPCIVENGCGIYIPQELSLFPDTPARTLNDGGRLIEFGQAASKVRQSIENISQKMRIDFRPYSKLSDEAFARATGLDREAATRARNRDFSETLTASLARPLWIEVNEELSKVGLQCLFGGRFHTAMDARCSKGIAMRKLVDAYRETFGGQWESIAIGDSLNDFDMLQAADKPYLVQQSDGSWQAMDLPRLQRVPSIGPMGWLEAVNQALPLIETEPASAGRITNAR